MTTTEMTELDRRINDGIDVRLLWNAEDGRVVVTVDDAKTGESFTVDVRERDKALEVFRHPYAFAAWHEAGIRRAAPLAA